MFYEALRFCGDTITNQPVRASGSAKEGPHMCGGSELGSYEDLMNVLRILAPGGSFCRILRGSEALGGTMSNEAVSPGGSAKEGPHVRGGI